MSSVRITLMAVFSIALLSLASGSYGPQAYAGWGSWEDVDNDGYSPNQGDCDDNDPTKFPGQGCDVQGVAEVKALITKLENLITIGSFDITDGQADSLLKQLENVVTELNAGDAKSAEQTLQTFANRINSFINSKTISIEDGNAILAEVKRIMSLIQP